MKAVTVTFTAFMKTKLPAPVAQRSAAG